MRMLRAEFAYFLGAVQFLTRLPIPHLDGFAPEWLERGVKYFPLVGIVVGAICAAVLLAASTLWTGVLPAILAVAAGIAATGAFHEDGLGDFFDAMAQTQRPARGCECSAARRLCLNSRERSEISATRARPATQPSPPRARSQRPL